MKKIVPRIINTIALLTVSLLTTGQNLSRMEEMTLDDYFMRSIASKTFDEWESYIIPVENNGKYGFMNFETKDTVVPCIYDTVDYFTGNLAAVRLNKKWGFVNKNGLAVIECQFDSAASLQNGLLQVVKNNRSGCVDIAGKEIIPIAFEEIITDNNNNNLVWVKKSGKYGLYTSAGRQLSTERFEYYQNFSEERAWVMIGGLWGFINTDGVLLITPKYESVEAFKEGMALVYLYDYYGFVNTIGEEVVSRVYKEGNSFSEGLAAVKNYNDFWLYLDKKGDYKIFSEQYVYAGPFTEGFAKVGKKINNELLYGIINKQGKEVISIQYEEIAEWGNSMIAVKQYDKWGYCNIAGQLTISCRFDKAFTFNKGEARVESGDAYFINKQGQYIRSAKIEENNPGPFSGAGEKASFTVDYIDNYGKKIIAGKSGDYSFIFSNNAAIMVSNGKYGFINKNGNIIVPCIYDSAISFTEGVAAVKKNGKWAYIYQDNDTLTSFKYDFAYNFNNGLAVVKRNNLYGYLSKTGSEAIPCVYNKAYTFKDTLAIVRMDHRVGFINKSGKLVIPCIYDDAYDFSEGLAAVQKNGKWGFINTKNEIIIAPMFDQALDFHEGLAAVGMNGKVGFIDKSGYQVIPFVYQSAVSFNKGVAVVTDFDLEKILLDAKGNQITEAKINSAFIDGLAIVVNEQGKKGFINREGKIVIACKYEEAFPFSEGLAAVSENNKWGFINKYGSLIIPLQFDGALFFKEGLCPIVNFKK